MDRLAFFFRENKTRYLYNWGKKIFDVKFFIVVERVIV